MAKPAFIYAFDNMEPSKFTELCGLLLGSRYKGFLLGGVGADGGIDGEVDEILGEWRPETEEALINETVKPDNLIVFQFKHKVAARVGQANSRNQLLNLFECDTSKTTKKCELHSKLIQIRKPSTYVLVTNVEVNSEYRNKFIEKCKAHNPDIKNYQVIGLDELEGWITSSVELRHLYFPTIFGEPRFNLRLKINTEFVVSASKTEVLSVTVFNIGLVPSYISNMSNIRFGLIIDGVETTRGWIFNDAFHKDINPMYPTRLEPGLKYTYVFSLSPLREELSMLGKDVFLYEITFTDEIGNRYSELVDDKIRSKLF